ncbi:MAG: dephospho-CoA kinase [Tidjanibacter sp.]|nr:dephospho-CoA kinase [Tidjanibacter sp.]
MRLGITGGIGSGKSVVCCLLAMLDVPIYDSDSRAKWLMNNSLLLRERLQERFGNDIFGEGGLQRKVLAERVFSDREALAALDAIVHPAVAEDFLSWAAEREAEGAEIVGLESAILFSSGFDKFVDRCVAVVAPDELRVARAAQRDRASEEQVRARIASQMPQSEVAERADYVVVNDEQSLLWAQVLRLIEELKM